MPTEPADRSHSIALYSLTTLWAAAALVVWGWMVGYGFTSYGTDIVAASVWPADVAFEHDAQGPRVVFCVHPKCPCTVASVKELNWSLRAAREAGVDPRVLVLATAPADADASWRKTSVLELCRALPGAVVRADADGVEAAKFGARTSGSVLAYGSDGRRLFCGGVTAARGHEGANTAARSLASALVDPGGDAARTRPVFGCRLCLPSEAPAAPCGEQCPLDTPANVGGADS